MGNDNGTPTPEEQKKSGYTKVILPDGTPKYYPSSLGATRIRQLATSQSSVPRGTSQEKESTWDKIWKPNVSGETIQKASGTGTREERQKEVEKEIVAGHPVRAGIKSFTAGFDKDATDFLSQFTSLGQLALLTVSGGDSLIAKVAPEVRVLKTMMKIPNLFGKVGGTTAAVAFGSKAAVDLATPQQKGEADADYLQRKLYDASAVFGTIGGVGATAKDTAHAILRRQMGLNEDLAGKVSDQVQRVAAERARGVAEKATIDAQAASKAARIDQATAQNVSQAKGISATKVSAITQSLDRDIASLQGETTSKAIDINSEAERRLSEVKGQISDLHAQRVKETAQIVSDSTLALDIEKGRVSAPFEDIGRKIKEPITTTTGVRDIVRKSFKDHGVKDTEIPTSALKALGKAKEAGDAYVDVGGDLQRLEMESAEPVSFNDLTRVREDLWQSSQSTKDGAVRTALLDAREEMTKMQASAAKGAGLGEAYKKAKDDYRDFKRGIGSDLAAKFVDSSDAQAQAMVPKMKMLLNENTAEALRTVLASVGVDTGPLTEIIREMKGTAERAKTISPERRAQLAELQKSSGKRAGEIQSAASKNLREATTEGKERLSDIERAGEEQSSVVEQQARELGKESIKSAEDKAKAIKEKDEVVPGRDVEELTGLSPEKLTEERVRAMFTKSRSSGVQSLGSLAWVVFGLTRLAMNSPLGGIMAVRGLSSMEVPELARSRTFQDWMIRKSGVEPYSKRGASMRLGIARLYPLLRKLAAQGQTEAAAEEEARKKRPPTREEVLQQSR